MSNTNNKHFSEINIDDVDLNELVKLDDNKELLSLLLQRLAFGTQKYGHGVNVDTDTTNFDTKENSWLLMALEEQLDQMIYTTSSLLRLRRELINRGLPN